MTSLLHLLMSLAAGMEQERTSKLGSALSALQTAAQDCKRHKQCPAALIIFIAAS